ncbi:MAG: UDP-glucose/GDP-mannose dehydrogenase family protein [Candidatus Daviesbacteria bacterium]|nr:UDP-glucose/GDP-mannose dehydrogenase family protein [Candidatus Daviesbacteria bacterium]
MTITIIGTGYVGLVTGAILADSFNQVYCVDIDSKKIESLNSGAIPFYEPGLAEIIKRNTSQDRLKFTTSYSESIPTSKIVLICVGTPTRENGEANLDYLFTAIEEVAQNLKEYTVLVIKSTTPIETFEKLNEIVKANTQVPYDLTSCPEFLREGSAVKDTVAPEKIVIGSSSQKATDLLLELFREFPGERIICDLPSAQMIKYAANCFLATKISYANAIANICERCGADSKVVLEGMGTDPRIGKSFLNPGVGFGGSCFPKDLKAFVKISEDLGVNFQLLEEVLKINSAQIDNFVHKITQALGSLEGKKIGILGLAFKPNTDDIREAPSLKIIDQLLSLGATVCAYDPIAVASTQKVLGEQIEYKTSAYEVAEGADALLLVTEWDEFKELDLVRIKSLMRLPFLFDGRNLYDPQTVKSLGFTYFGVGRG